jgi:putative DNA primase/helicase
MLLKRLEAASYPDDLSLFVVNQEVDTLNLSQLSDDAPPSYITDVPIPDAPPHDIYFDEMNAPDIPDTDFDWQADLVMDSKGNMVKNSLHNTELMLNYHKAYRGVFRYNEFKSDTMLVKCPPWIRDGKFRAHRLDDNDLTKCTSHMERFGLKPDTNRVFRAIKSVAYDNKFHPVRQYFDTLVWDGTPRLEGWLTYYLGAVKESEEYLSFIGKMWLKAAVKRVYKPGCKFDHMLVLEGKQGVGKSTVLRELATFGDEGLEESYFTDGIKISDIGSKDLIQLLQGSLIVELAELAGFSKKDDNEVKNWITNQVDRCRLPYEKTDTDFPRQFVLSATTNDYEYLKDPTGNRRYWPVEVGAVDLYAIRRDRLQLWAEAVSLYKANESLWPTEDEIALCRAEQDKRRNVDVWENKVMDAVQNLGVWSQTDGFETDKIMQDMGLSIRDMGQQEKTRVNNILRANGYEQKRKRHGDGFKRVWVKV